MFCFAALADMHTGTMYTNGTGAFPVRSFCNMQYVFVAYIYDLNAILVRAMPSKNDGAMIAAFKEILTTLNTRGYAPTLNVMDNECSEAVEAHIRSHNMDIHLVPPHNCHVNAAERVIATFKEHFISALATVDKDCPLQLWDDFLPQVELTLNLLKFSRQDTTKSANEEVNRKFDYNKMPLAPLGTKGLVYEDPMVRASWAPHRTDAYYVGAALKHYGPAFLHAGYPAISCGGHLATLSDTLRHTDDLQYGTNNHPSNGHTHRPRQNSPIFHK